MNKKYIVRLSDQERRVCQDIIKNLKCRKGDGFIFERNKSRTSVVSIVGQSTEALDKMADICFRIRYSRVHGLSPVETQ